LAVFVRQVEENLPRSDRSPSAIAARSAAAWKRVAKSHVDKGLAQTIAKTKMLQTIVELFYGAIFVYLIGVLAQFDMQNLEAEEAEQDTETETKRPAMVVHWIVQCLDIAPHRFPEGFLGGIALAQCKTAREITMHAG